MDPRGLGFRPLLPFLPLGNKRRVSRKHSRRNASLAPSTSGKGGQSSGIKLLIMGAEMLVPVEEGGVLVPNQTGSEG